MRRSSPDRKLYERLRSPSAVEASASRRLTDARVPFTGSVLQFRQNDCKLMRDIRSLLQHVMRDAEDLQRAARRTCAA